MSSPTPPITDSPGDMDHMNQLGELFPEGGKILCKDLLDVIRTYETRHSTLLLSTAEKALAQEFCEGHPDVEVTSDGLRQLISLMTRQNPPEPSPPRPTPPPTSFTRPRRPKRKSSSSFRIKSASDSSSTSGGSDGELEDSGMELGDDEETSKEGWKISPSSAPADKAFDFPSSSPTGSSSGVKSPPTSFNHSSKPRKFTTSDPSKPHLPSSQSMSSRLSGRNAAPPTSFPSGSSSTPIGSARKVRRGSEGELPQMDPHSTPQRSGIPLSYSTPMGLTTGSSTPLSRPRPAGRPSHRRRSSAQQPQEPIIPLPSASPTPLASARPLSPDGGIDERSFARGLISPELQGMSAAIGTELDVDDDEARVFQGEMRLARLNTNSTNSLVISHDKLETLQKANTEMGRKNAELQRQLSAIGSDNEKRIEELQDRLEEAKNELVHRRKEEKELKGKERNQNIQLASLESDVANLQRALDNSKASYAEMLKAHQSQCAETERVRQTVLARDEESAEQREVIEGHEEDKARWESEHESLKASMAQLEASLDLARRAEVELQQQKQENLNLKETISRLEFDISEMRTQSAGHVRGATRGISSATDSNPATLSRNLGDEMARSLRDQLAGDDVKEVEKVENGVRTVYKTVTIHTERTLHEFKSAPEVILEETQRSYADASTSPIVIPTKSAAVQTDISMSSMLPPYTAKEEPSAESVMEHAHPPLAREDGGEDLLDVIELEEGYIDISLALGTRCHVLEKKLAEKQGRVLRADGGDISRSISRRARANSTAIIPVAWTKAASDNPWVLPAAVVFIAVAAYHVGIHHATMDPASLNNALLLRDISALRDGSQGYLAGEWVWKAVGGGAKQIYGRVPI